MGVWVSSEEDEMQCRVVRMTSAHGKMLGTSRVGKNPKARVASYTLRKLAAQDNTCISQWAYIRDSSSFVVGCSMSENTGMDVSRHPSRCKFSTRRLQS